MLRPHLYCHQLLMLMIVIISQRNLASYEKKDYRENKFYGHVDTSLELFIVYYSFVLTFLQGALALSVLMRMRRQIAVGVLRNIMMVFS